MRLIGLLVVALLLTACGTTKAATPDEEAQKQAASMPADESPADATEPEAGPATAPDAILANDGTRQVGDVTTCPVTGDVFTISATTITVEHEGGTYFFCCKGCVKDFNADPAKFLTQAPVAAEPAADDGAKRPSHQHKHDHNH